MPSVYKFRRGFKKFADDQSIELRKQVGIKPSHALPALKLAEHLNIRVLYPNDIHGIDTATLNCLLKGADSKWSGVALQIADQPLLIINSSHSKARQESSIMHELAHIICKHEMGEFRLLSEGIFLREFNQDQEKEAEWLGGCLQLPAVALYYNYKKDGLSHAEIADKFNSSIDMVRFRINVCGFRNR